MIEGGPRATRITDLEEVKKLVTRPSREEREKLAKQGIHYVGNDEFFEKLQETIAASGAILRGHFELPAEEIDTTL